MVSVVFCWWIVCVTLMKTWITRRSLHHMRLSIHHVSHCFWICGRWSCVWSKDCLKIKYGLVFRVEMQKARRLERIVDKCPIQNRTYYCHISIPFSQNERWNKIFVFYCVICMKYISSLNIIISRAFVSPIFVYSVFYFFHSKRSHHWNTFICWKMPDPFVFIYLSLYLVWSEWQRDRRSVCVWAKDERKKTPHVRWI